MIFREDCYYFLFVIQNNLVRGSKGVGNKEEVWLAIIWW